MTVQPSTQNDLFNLDLIRSYVDKGLNPRFVERDWLKRQVEGKLADSACRFVLLTAEPGAGKSAFMAWLANQHPYWCRYFIRRDQRTPLGDVGSYSFLLQVGFQLAVTYPDLFKQEQIRIVVEQRIGTATNSEIVGAEIGKMFASPFYEKVIQIQQQVTHSKDTNVTGVRIGEFYATERDLPIENLQFMALFDPARAMLEQVQQATNHPQRQIVVLVDALDELRYQNSELSLLKWLTNCPELPANLRFVLTCRPDDDLLRAFRGSQQGRIQEISIAEEDADVEKDLTLYTRFLIETPEVNQTLIEMHQDSDAFTRQAITKANGNFGYLGAIGRAVDEAICQNEQQLLREILKLSELPDTLQDLYAFFLSKIKVAVDKEKVPVEDAEGEIGFMPIWSAVYKPILGILSVALEPLTPTQIQKLGLIQAEFDYVTGAIEKLQQFLDQLGNCYRLYHSTLPEFFTSPKTKEQTDYSYCYVDAIKQNQRIVNYYQAGKKTWAEVDLKKIAEDDYGRRHLAEHLVKGDRVEELHTLLSLEKDGKNAWFNAKDRIGETAEFLTDIKLAWEQTYKAFERQPTRFTELQCRYALIISSVNSLASSIPPILLEELVKQKVWNLSKAISYTRQVTDGEHRVESLARLLPYLQEPDREQCFKEGLAAVQSIATDIWRLEPLQALITYLPDPKPKPLLEAVLQQIWKFNDRKLRMEALVEVAPDLNQDLATEAYSIVVDDNDIEVDGERMWRVIAMSKLYPNLSKYHQQQAVKVMRADAGKITEGGGKAIAIESMINLNDLKAESAQLLITALESVRLQSFNEWMKPRALLKLIPHVSNAERVKFLDEILQSLQGLSGVNQRELLSQIAAQVEQLSLQRELLSAVKKYWGKECIGFNEWFFPRYNYILMLAKLTPYMPRELQTAIVQESIDLADNILNELHDEFSKGTFLNALAELTPYMKPTQVSWVHSKIQRILSVEWRLQSLSSLISSLPKEESEILIRELLVLTQTLKHDPYSKNQLTISWENIVPYFSTSLLQEALVACQAINDVRSRTNLFYFVHYLTQKQKLVAFQWILTLASGDDAEWCRAFLLSSSAPYLPNCFWDEALTIARALTLPIYRAKALTALALVLPISQKQQVLVEVTAVIERIDSISALCQARIDLLPALESYEQKELVTKILVNTDKLEDMNKRAIVWVQLLPFLGKSKRAALLKSAVDLVKFSRHEDQALKILAPHLPLKLVREILENRWYRFSSFDESIPALLARLTELGQPHVAVRYIHHINHQQTRHEALLSVAPHLSLSSIYKVWHEVLRLEDKYKDFVLEALCLRLTKLDQVKLAQTALLWQISENSQARVNALLGMAPYLDMNEQVKMLQEVLFIINRNNSVQWTNLASCLAQCSPPVLANFWEKALHLLSATNRQQLIPSLYSLTPVITTLSTTETLSRIFSDIEDVVRWWP